MTTTSQTLSMRASIRSRPWVEILPTRSVPSALVIDPLPPVNPTPPHPPTDPSLPPLPDPLPTDGPAIKP